MHRSPLTRQARLTDDFQNHINTGRPGGIDLVYADGNSFNQSLVAITDGVITYTNTNYQPRPGENPRLRGEKLLQLRGTDGIIYQYNHLNSINVTQGQTVKAGQQIATMGFTGWVEPPNINGTHLHFEVWVNGVRKDPLQFIDINKFNNQNNMPTKEQTAFRKLRNWKKFRDLKSDERQAIYEFNLIHSHARLINQSNEIKNLKEELTFARNLATNAEGQLDTANQKNFDLENENKDLQKINDELFQIQSKPAQIANKATQKQNQENQPYKTPSSTIIANDTVQKVLKFIESVGGAAAGLALLSPQLEAVNIDISTGVIGLALGGVALLVDKYLESEKVKRKRMEKESAND